MNSIKDLDINQLKILLAEKIASDVKAPKVLKKINSYYKDFLKIKNDSENKTDFESKINDKINSTRENNNVKAMLNTMKHFVNAELYETGTDFLELNYDTNKFYLSYVKKGYIANTPNNTLFMLRNLISNFPKDYVSLYPNEYLKLENFMRANSDILVWFNDFINETYFAFKERENQLSKHLEILYGSLSDEKKIEVKKKIEAYNLTVKITERNISLENRIGKKKTLIKPFIKFYKENKSTFGKAENCFNEFKKNYPDISNDNYKSFEKTIYAYGYKLK